MGEVVVLGSLNRDLVLHLDRLPAAGETLSARGSTEQPGGKGANQAAAAARAGASVRMVGTVGDDRSAAVVLDPLRREGVDVTAVRTVSDVATGLAVVSVSADGQNSIVVVPGANGHLDHREAAAAAPGVGGVLLCQLEVPTIAVATAAERARRRGARVMLNAAPATTDALEVLPLVDVLVVNEHEASLLADEVDPSEAGRSLAAAHGLVCVVTLGAAGAVAYGATPEPFALPAPRVAAVDSTGAGDTFTGYLAAGLAAGAGLAASLSDAVRAGALAVTRRGALDAVPHRDDLDALEDPDQHDRYAARP